MQVRKLVKLLKKNGWKKIRQKGSHMIFKKGNNICVVPNHHGDIPTGTLNGILKTSGIVLESTK